MGAAIWLFIKPYALKALFVLAAVVAVLGMLARVRNAGRLAERVEVAAASARIEREMAQAQSARRTKDDMVKRLQEHKF